MLISVCGRKTFVSTSFFPALKMVMAPVRPINIRRIIIILPGAVKSGVMPADTPDVERAENTSNIIWTRGFLSVMERIKIAAKLIKIAESRIIKASLTFWGGIEYFPSVVELCPLLKDFTGGARGAALTRRRRGGPRRRSGLVRAHKCAGGIIPEFLSNVNSIIHVFPPFSKFPALFSGGMPLPKILFQKRNKPPNIDLFRRKILVLYIK